MKVGRWEITLGFPYYRLPEDWEDLNEAFKRSRPLWDVIGIHLWHEITDEALMLEIRFHKKKLELRAQPEYTHLPAYWIVMACDCSECKPLRRKLKGHKDGRKEHRRGHVPTRATHRLKSGKVVGEKEHKQVIHELDSLRRDWC